MQSEMFGDKLDGLEAESISFLNLHYPSEQGYWEVAFSGGKDSCVLYRVVQKWSQQTGQKFHATYVDTTIDAPEVRHFIRDNYPEVDRIKVYPSFFARTKTRGIPLRSKRWCCDALKKEPRPQVNTVTGIRADESYQRRARGRINDYGKFSTYHPLFWWTGKDVLDYIKRENLPKCSLYDEGFERIGCIICPQLSPRQMARNKARWPNYYRAFEKVFKERWERTYGADADWEKALNNWYMNLPLLPKRADGNELNFKGGQEDATGIIE